MQMSSIEGKGMNGRELDCEADGQVVPVFLACISCGKIEEIHVFPARELPPEIYWECLDCQKREERSGRTPRS